MSNNEPTIIINGTTLNVGQAMALRVAATDFFHQMQEPEALGDDEHGLALTAGYKARLAEILKIMITDLHPIPPTADNPEGIAV